MRTLVLAIGLVLLLPGACSLVLLLEAGPQALVKAVHAAFSGDNGVPYNQILSVLFLSGLLSGAIGGVLIRLATRPGAARNGEADDQRRAPL